MDLVTLRTALLISLSMVLILVLFQRFRRKAMATELPAPLHAELLVLEVAYHPARLVVEVKLPDEQVLLTRLHDAEHRPVHAWPDERARGGRLHLERMLPDLAPGTYHFELATATQRTVRRFRLQP